MSVLDSIKALFVRILRNVVEVADRLSEQTISLDANGDARISPTLIEVFASKISAVIIGAAAMFFFLSPGGGQTVYVGDRLMRVAVMLWEGSNEGVKA